jgi:integrase
MAKSGHVHMAVAILTAFHCYLRMGDLLKLRASDIAFPGDVRLGGSVRAVLRVGKGKTGTNQSVVLTDTDVVLLLQHIMKGRSATDRLFPFTDAQYNRTIRASCLLLGIINVAFTSHSCRHGGATHDYLHGVPMEDIIMRGRWRAAESARIYVQSLRAIALTVNDIPLEVYDIGNTCATHLATNIIALSQ